MSITHCLRFGTHAENKYFLGENASLYDFIVFNGNMVAYTKSAIAAFIINANEKKFIIDPQTHAFQHDPSYLKTRNSKGEMQIKKSISQLAESLGEPVVSRLAQDLPLVPSNFDEPASIESLARGTIGFQKGIIDEIKGNGDWEYLAFKLAETGAEEPKPSGLIAPYFYMTEATAPKWLEVNTKLITASVQFCDDFELMAQVVIAKDVLVSDEMLGDVIDAYKNSEASTVLLWIDSLSEVSASKGELVGLKRLCNELKQAGKKVFSLYGGYYSIMLANKGMLDGVCHGLEYGENRAVVPVGGGIPMAKYYFYPLHFRMRYADLLTIYSRKGWTENPSQFGETVCGCQLCQDGSIEKFGITNPVRTRRGANIITLNYPTPETKDFSLRHYLYSKHQEYAMGSEKSYEEIKAELQASKQEYEGILGLEAVAHIDRWISAIEA